MTARRKRAAPAMVSHLARLQEIGVALSAEHDLRKLLDLILKESRRFTSADAGSIFIREDDVVPNENATAKDELFTTTPLLALRVVQNDSKPHPLPEIKLPFSNQTIAGYVGLSGRVLNLKDAYRIPPSEPYTYSTAFDRASGYRCKSMLVIPMRNRDGEVIGIIQLINKKKKPERKLKSPEEVEKNVVPFGRTDEKLLLSLASQAGISIEKAKLYEGLEKLFEGFVMSLVTALEKRNKTTFGHSMRVAEYALAIARAMNETADGPFRDVHFTDEQLLQLRHAGLLHDIGKLGVPEAVLDKRNKLTDAELSAIDYRIAYASQRLHNDLALGPEEVKDRTAKLASYLGHIKKVNIPKPMSDDDVRLLDEIQGTSFVDTDGSERPLLSAAEYENLSVRRGNLTVGERKIIEQHIVDTWEILKRIPWPPHLRHVPHIAATHHEKLNRSGYPWKFSGEDIPLGGKILALVDIFEALTAKDRPYKPAIPVDRALKILEEEVAAGNLDREIFRLFVDKKIYNLFLRSETGFIVAPSSSPN